MAKNPIPKIKDIPISDAQRTVMFDMYATINVHRYTGINPHSNPNQNRASIPAIRAGFNRKKLIISTLLVVNSTHSCCIRLEVTKRDIMIIPIHPKRVP